MRIYDTRVGRFLSVDPLTPKYPELTPYQFGSNNPIENIDLDGLEGVPAKRQPDGDLSTAQSSTYVKPVQRPQIKVTPAIVIREQTIAMADIHGHGWIGPAQSYVLPNVAAVEQAHRDEVSDNVKSGPIGTIAYIAGGDKWSYVGAIGDDVMLSFSGMKDEPAFFGPKVEPSFEPVYRLPVSNGSWSGQAGNSNWNSTLEAVNGITGGEGIPFVNGKPNFAKWSVATFSVEGLTGSAADFALIYKKMATDLGFKSPTAAKNWLKDNNLTPHHDTGNSVQIIPTTLNNIPHSGGASDLRSN